MQHTESISQHLEILRRKTWFFTDKKLLQAQLQALNALQVAGAPGVLYHLVPLLTSRVTPLRNRTVEVVAALMKQCASRQHLYETLKHLPVQESDLRWYQTAFDPEHCIVLLGMASMNANGYVRERAVQGLAAVNSTQSLELLIYRLADWVEPVRKKAEQAVRQYFTPDSLPLLIQNLSNFEALSLLSRTDYRPLLDEVYHFVVHTNRPYLQQFYHTFPDNIRLLLARRMDLQPDDADLRLMLDDRTFLVRRLVPKHLDRLGETEINRLLSDPSAPIRFDTLRQLQRQQRLTEFTALSMLGDPSASVRAFCRQVLPQHASGFAALYLKNVRENKQVAGSMLGLAEVRAAEASGILIEYCHSERPELRHAALSALMRLDATQALPLALEAAGQRNKKIRTTALGFLQRHPTPEVLEQLRQTYRDGDQAVRLSILKMFCQLGGWIALAELVRSTTDEYPALREAAVEYLKSWKKKAVRLFERPSPAILQHLKQTLHEAEKIHQEHRFFDRNPLEDLHFYLTSY